MDFSSQTLTSTYCEDGNLDHSQCFFYEMTVQSDLCCSTQTAIRAVARCLGTFASKLT